jgi:hypothetical protein
MPYYDVANLVTLIETNLMHEMPDSYGTLRTTAVRIRQLSLPLSCAEVSSCSKI